ncbi:UNVERIFIED_CONTAM: hypothetical protein FKN15_001654 [Acipenser sinensis]
MPARHGDACTTTPGDVDTSADNIAPGSLSAATGATGVSSLSAASTAQAGGARLVAINPLSARRLTTFLLSAGKLPALPPEAEEWQECATPLSALLLTALQPVDPLKLLFLAQDYYRDFWAFKGEVAVEAMCAVHKGGVICGYSGARDINGSVLHD